MHCWTCGMQNIPDALDKCPSCGMPFITDRIYEQACPNCHATVQVRVPRVFSVEKR